MAAAWARASALVASVRGRPRETSSPRPSADPALDAVNEQFHEAYDGAREAAKYDGPVFVVLADELIVFRHDEREALSFSPRAFHVLKSAAHAPVALYAMFARAEPVPEADVATARKRVVSALESSSLAWPELDGARGDLKLVLQGCRDFIDRVGETRVSEASLRDFAGGIGPALLRLTAQATSLQLQALHHHTEQALAALTSEEQARLRVVVAGDHQARARSLAMQYFQKRLPEPAGSEARVTYAEGVRDESAALALVGTQRFDRAIAQAFFGEAGRLQRDILGDAAERQLRSFTLATI